MKSFKVEYLVHGSWVECQDSPMKASCRKAVTALHECSDMEENNGTVKIRQVH